MFIVEARYFSGRHWPQNANWFAKAMARRACATNGGAEVPTGQQVSGGLHVDAFDTRLADYAVAVSKSEKPLDVSVRVLSLAHFTPLGAGARAHLAEAIGPLSKALLLDQMRIDIDPITGSAALQQVLGAVALSARQRGTDWLVIAQPLGGRWRGADMLRHLMERRLDGLYSRANIGGQFYYLLPVSTRLLQVLHSGVDFAGAMMGRRTARSADDVAAPGLAAPQDRYALACYVQQKLGKLAPVAQSLFDALEQGDRQACLGALEQLPDMGGPDDIA